MQLIRSLKSILVNNRILYIMDKKNHLELFSGTHSFGKVSHELGYNVVSLDRDLGATCPFGTDYKSATHIQEDIMKWDYTVYPKDHFQLITLSPVCLWWSNLRNSWLGRCIKAFGDKPVTKELLQNDIETLGKPMVDKCFEIIKYFNPEKWILENPKTGKMKHYIEEKYAEYNTYYDIDYCMYSDWGYQKPTRFWTNIKGFEPKTCNKECGNMITFHNEETKKDQKIHRVKMGSNKIVCVNNKLIRVNTKPLREKYKDTPQINMCDLQSGVVYRETTVHKYSTGGSIHRSKQPHNDTKLHRYRVPQPFIKEILVAN